MSKRVFFGLLTVFSLSAAAMAQPLETVLDFNLKGVKGIPKEVGGYELVRVTEYKKGEVETNFLLRVTWSFPDEDRVEDYKLDTISGDEDYNEYVVVAGEKELERIGVSAVTIHNLLAWAHIAGDFPRLESSLSRKKHAATVELVYTAAAKKELIEKKVFRANRFKGDKVVLNYRTKQSALLIKDQKPVPKSYCYRGKVEDAASLVEQFVANIDGENGMIVNHVAVAPDGKGTLHADYILYDEESEEVRGKLQVFPCN